MDEKLLMDEIGKKTADQIKAAIDAAKAGDQEQATALEAKLVNQLGADSDHVKAMQTQLDQISTNIQKQMVENVKIKTIKSALLDIGRTNEFKSIRTNRTFQKEIPLDLEEKVVTVMNSGMTGHIPKPMWLPGVFRAPDQAPFLSQLCPIVPTASNTVWYINRTTRTNGAAAQTEGSALGQSDVLYTQASATVVDTGSFLKVSDNAIEDNADFLMGEINAELPWMVLDAQDAAILALIVSGATAFSAAAKPYLSAVVNANYYDVLRAAINQARAQNFQPDTILVHNDDYAMMEMSKTATGEYTIPNWASLNGLSVSGVRVVPNNQITTGTYVVCTLGRTPLAMRQNLVLEFGYDHDDFSKRLLTARAYVRSAYIFSTQMALGFIKGTFADDAATLAL